MSHVITLLLTTVPDADSAQKLASAALDARLAACVSQSAVHSQYHWRGAQEQADEIQLTFKTSNARVLELEHLIQARHPYATPEILSWQVTASSPYGQWVEAETQRIFHV